MYGEAKLFCTGPPKATIRPVRNILYRHDEPNEPLTKYSISPHLPQFQQIAEATLSLVSLSENLLDGLWEAEEVRVEAQQEEEVECGKAGRTVLHNAR